MLKPKCPAPVHSLVRSYGVTLEIASNEAGVLERSLQVIDRAMLGRARAIETGVPSVRFKLERSPKGTLRLFQNGERIASSRSEFKFYKFFDAVVRVTIGEHARDRVFLHAGVVGWRGKALIFPADSFQGKSSLVAELVRQGADYYSDDFAVIDSGGLVHPFPRPLAMRTDERKMKLYELTAEDLGGKVGRRPIPVRAVVFTHFKRGARWRPRPLTPGQGLLSLVPFTLPIRLNPEFSVQVLNIVTARAILLSSPRGEANIFTQNLLNYVDKRVC